jgi:hypothetical protein
LEWVDDQLSGDYQFLDFVELYRKLRSLDIPFVVVGGQAVNLWASTYETEAESLPLFRPFTSRDLDLYTESQDAVTKTANALNCECVLGGVDSPDIVMGALWLGDFGNESPLVQFLNGMVGIKNSAEIFKTQEESAFA